MATRKRKTFDPSLKLEVVRMIKEQGQSIQNDSENMSIGQTAIRRWLTQYGAEQSGQPKTGIALHGCDIRIVRQQLRPSTKIPYSNEPALRHATHGRLDKDQIRRQN